MQENQRYLTTSILDSLRDRAVYAYVKRLLAQGYVKYGIPRSVAQEILRTLRDRPNLVASAQIEHITALNNADSLFWSARTFYKTQLFRHKEILSHIGRWIFGPSVLEAGCADGGLGRLIAADKNLQYVGTDIFIEPHQDLPLNMRLLTQPSSTNISVQNSTINTALLIDMLHHVPEEEQGQLLSSVRDKLQYNGRIILYEYTYSTKQEPLQHSNLLDSFLILSKQQKHDSMAIIDWIGNVLVGGRTTPMPYSYKELEEWKELFEKVGFVTQSIQYLGLSQSIFHPGTYGLLVASKT